MHGFGGPWTHPPPGFRLSCEGGLHLSGSSGSTHQGADMVELLGAGQHLGVGCRVLGRRVYGLGFG